MPGGIDLRLPWDETRGIVLRLIAAGFGLVALYYVWFFVAVRQEASTLLQIGVLVLAVAVLLVPLPTGARLTSRQLWAASLVALGLVAAVFVWADHDSHSASDTLNRALPTLCLVVAVFLRVVGLGSSTPLLTRRPR